MKAQSTMIKAT